MKGGYPPDRNEMDPIRVISESAIANYESAECLYFASGCCSSCSLLTQPIGRRIPTKMQRLLDIFSTSGVSPNTIEEFVIPKHPWGSRHKIKMSVAGTIEAPMIGIANAEGHTQDLSTCPLMPPRLHSLMPDIKSTIQNAHLIPYDIATRRGELKGIIVLMNRDGSQGILRFVLRSTEAIPRIRKALPTLHERHPWLRVTSCNIQPLHAAIPEGPEELILTSEHTIEEQYAGIPLTFAPQSFMQVTPEIAEALYQRAARYVETLSIHSALDLFCGVGGFSFAIAPFVRKSAGIEISQRAIESASRTAEKLGHSHLSFIAGDVDLYLTQTLIQTPDLVIANPPRRGLSTSVKQWLLGAAPRHFLYSSCNPETFCRDAVELAGSYTLTTLAPFDMFPLTSHIEVLGFFAKR